MRALTDLERQNELFLTEKGVRFVMVLMTENILSHHIFDATKSVDKFLKEEGIHDFSMQQNGEKKYIDAHLLTFKEEKVIHSSVYKAAKRGDKRMWFGAEIIPVTSPDDICLMVSKEGTLYILNMSHIDLLLCFNTGISNPIKIFLKELLSK